MSVKLTHFLQNLSIDSITGGRFIVKVPFHEDCSELGASNDKVFLRFRSLENALIQQQILILPIMLSWMFL